MHHPNKSIRATCWLVAAVVANLDPYVAELKQRGLADRAYVYCFDVKAFRDEAIEHLVIGAHALAAYGHVEATLDIDIRVKPTVENAAGTWRALTELEFDAAWPNRITATLGGVEAPVLGLDDMRTAKRAAGRLKDLADLEELG